MRVFFRGPIQCVCRSIALLFLLKATQVHPKSQFHICFMTYTLFLVVFCLFSMSRVTCVLPKKNNNRSIRISFHPSTPSHPSCSLFAATGLVLAGNQLPGFVCSVCVVLPGSGQTAEAPPLAGPPPLMRVTVRGGH